MGRYIITILESDLNQQIAAQVKEILQREPSYEVVLMRDSVRIQEQLTSAGTQLIIPVLPATWRRAQELLSQLKQLQNQIPLLPVISSNALREALETGLDDSHDFLITPLREAEVCFRVKRLTSNDRQPQVPSTIEARAFAQIIGEDPAFLAVKRKIPSVARFESTVLLMGETGTGKERFARALHYSSRRAGSPFLAVNCGAIPEDLFESEPYGHRKGAFTGACTAQAGLIAEAENGTLFLDEIETLSLSGQVKLLRFLQEHEYQHLGGTRLQKADIRIIAASNRDVGEAIGRGTFRRDLLYRLQVFDIMLPSLRERVADIPLLAEHFLAEFAQAVGGRPARLLDDAFSALVTYDWPGNVRELRNVLERAAILSSGEISCSDLAFCTRRRATLPTADLRSTERVSIERILRETDWNKSKAARRLGLTRTQLYTRLRRHGLQSPHSDKVAVA